MFAFLVGPKVPGLSLRPAFAPLPVPQTFHTKSISRISCTRFSARKPRVIAILRLDFVRCQCAVAGAAVDRFVVPEFAPIGGGDHHAARKIVRKTRFGIGGCCDFLRERQNLAVIACVGFEFGSESSPQTCCNECCTLNLAS